MPRKNNIIYKIAKLTPVQYEYIFTNDTLPGDVIYLYENEKLTFNKCKNFIQNNYDNYYIYVMFKFTS